MNSCLRPFRPGRSCLWQQVGDEYQSSLALAGCNVRRKDVLNEITEVQAQLRRHVAKQSDGKFAFDGGDVGRMGCRMELEISGMTEVDIVQMAEQQPPVQARQRGPCRIIGPPDRNGVQTSLDRNKPIVLAARYLLERLEKTGIPDGK